MRAKPQGKAPWSLALGWKQWCLLTKDTHPTPNLQSLGVPLCSFMPIFPGWCISLKGGAFRKVSFQESHSNALARPVRTGLGVMCFMLGKIPLSTLSARTPLIDLEKTCATVSCGSQIEGLSLRNLKKMKGRTMKPRRSRRASVGGQTIGQVLESELRSEWENTALARGRSAWAEEVRHGGEGPKSAKSAFRKRIAFTGRR